MIEKLKLEPYVPDSLVVHVYSQKGTLVAERYDSIFWARDKFSNVACKNEFDGYVETKIFCTLATSLKDVALDGTTLKLTLFNGAKYTLDMVDGNLPTFEFPVLPNKSVFDFGGVEKATSKSPLQKELNMVYVDEFGAVATNSIVAAMSDCKFKSVEPFTVPEGIHSMVGNEEAEWGIFGGKLYVRFGAYELVAMLSKLPEFAWWEASRGAFEGVSGFTEMTGLASSISRLGNFGTMVCIRDGKLSVSSDRHEPFGLVGSGETFNIENLKQITSDERVGVSLFGGNLYVRTGSSLFVCCAVDVQPSSDEPPKSEPEVKAPQKANNKKK